MTNHLDFLIWNAQIFLDERAWDIIIELQKYNKTKADELAEKYEEQRAFVRILERMNQQGYESLDWERGVKDGLFCLMDYYRFKELAPFKQEGIKQYMEQGKQEIVDLLEKQYGKS